MAEWITYKTVSVTYDVLVTAKPSYLSTIQPAHCTDTLLLYCGTFCQLNCAVLKTVVRRTQIYYPNLHFCQNSRLISFTSPILAPLNLHLPLLHKYSSHLTWQVHGHQTNITALIIIVVKLSHQQWPWLQWLSLSTTVVTILHDAKISLCSASNTTLLLLFSRIVMNLAMHKFK